MAALRPCTNPLPRDGQRASPCGVVRVLLELVERGEHLRAGHGHGDGCGGRVDGNGRHGLVPIGLGFPRSGSAALKPCSRRDRGVQGQGRPGWRGIVRPAQADFHDYGCGENRIRAEGRGDHPGRRGVPRFTLPTPGGGASKQSARRERQRETGEKPDQDVQNRGARKPCILMAAVIPLVASDPFQQPCGAAPSSMRSRSDGRARSASVEDPRRVARDEARPERTTGGDRR